MRLGLKRHRSAEDQVHLPSWYIQPETDLNCVRPLDHQIELVRSRFSDAGKPHEAHHTTWVPQDVANSYDPFNRRNSIISFFPSRMHSNSVVQQILATDAFRLVRPGTVRAPGCERLSNPLPNPQDKAGMLPQPGRNSRAVVKVQRQSVTVWEDLVQLTPLRFGDSGARYRMWNP